MTFRFVPARSPPSHRQYQDEAHAAATWPVLGLALCSNASQLAIDAASPSRKKVVIVAAAMVATNLLLANQIEEGKVEKLPGSTSMLVNSAVTAGLLMSAAGLKHEIVKKAA